MFFFVFWKQNYCLSNSSVYWFRKHSSFW